MSLITLFTLAVGLSMDAFAVSICKGLAMRKITFGKAAIVGLWFGGFQGLMPLIGYLLGVQFKDKITAIDHWIAFVLLAIIGINMIREAAGGDDDDVEACDCDNASLAFRDMLLLAVATSIDALAVGITFAFLDVNIISAVSFIAVVTFTLSAIGVKVGNVFGTRYKSKAEIVGGVILILLGIKILFEHLGIL
jgi:putative Mn2+ efflux pump MntP